MWYLSPSDDLINLSYLRTITKADKEIQFSFDSNVELYVRFADDRERDIEFSNLIKIIERI